MTEKLKEQIYVIPLGKVRRAPRWKRSKTAMTDIRKFLSRHMKSEDVRLDMGINEHIWKQGSQNPPSRVRIRAMKFEDGQVQAELAEE
ncbi:MAG: 50S ribosomal protein L31e [Methanospirillaceae archaeon]|nr:50S ribosomal protein L31e [Methanospirillaceae archaeon]